MSSFGRPTACALAIVPGPAATITFVYQERGPYAGSWLLPGGKVEFGESLEEAARREAREESGCEVGALRLSGVYEMRGVWAEGAYHLIMFAFLAAEPVVVPEGFTGHHVGAVRQARPDELRPHPTVMRILRDVGAGDYPQAEIDAALARDGITMSRYPATQGALLG